MGTGEWTCVRNAKKMEGGLTMAEFDVGVAGERYRDYIRIRLSGRLVYENTQAAKEGLKTFFAEASEGYVLNLAAVSKIDSTGFGVLINFAKEVARAKSKVALVVPPGFMRELFTISKFHCIFPIVSSDEEAAAVLDSGYQTQMTLGEY